MDDEIIIGVTTTAKKGEGKKRPSPKKKKKNNKKFGILSKLVILLLIIGAVIVFLMVSPTFNITKIVVEGNSILSAEKIISLSEIKEGNNIFRFNSFSSSDKIKKNMYVESVSIKRELPDVVKIVVKERTIKYLIEYASGYAYISSQGYIIDISDEKKEVPILQGYSTDISDIKVGNRLWEEDLNRLNLVNNVANSAESYGILNLITRIDISNKENLLVILEGEGKQAYLGNCSDLVTRMGRLEQAIEQKAGVPGIIYLDGNTSNDKYIFKENFE